MADCSLTLRHRRSSRRFADPHEFFLLLLSLWLMIMAKTTAATSTTTPQPPTTTTTTTHDSSSWTTARRIPPPPPSLTSSSLVKSHAENLIRRPPPPHNDSEVENVNLIVNSDTMATSKEATTTVATFNGDADDPSLSISAVQATTVTTNEVDPILERFQRIVVGNRQPVVRQKEWEQTTDPSPYPSCTHQAVSQTNEPLSQSSIKLNNESMIVVDQEQALQNVSALNTTSMTAIHDERIENEHVLSVSNDKLVDMRLRDDNHTTSSQQVNRSAPPPPPPLQNGDFHSMHATSIISTTRSANELHPTRMHLPSESSLTQSATTGSDSAPSSKLEYQTQAWADQKRHPPYPQHVQRQQSSHHRQAQQQHRFQESPLHFHTQQQRYIPPPQYHQHYSQPLHQRQQLQHQQSSPSPIWKSLWSRVEQGLDGLANVEEKVAERTHQWTQQVTHKALELLPTSLLSTSTTSLTKTINKVAAGGNDLSDSGRSLINQSQPKKQQQQLKDQFHEPDPHLTGMLGGRKFASLPTQHPTTTSSLKSQQREQLSSSLSAMYLMQPVSDGGVEDSEDDMDEKEHLDARSSIANPWDSRPVLRAGASEVTPVSPTMTSRASSSSIPPLLTNAPSSSQQSPFSAEQQQQLQRPIEGVRKRPFAAQTEQLQQHSRPNPSTRQPYNSKSLVDDESDSFWSRIPRPSMPRLPSVVSKFLGRGSGSYRAMAAATLDVWKDEEQTSRRWAASNKRQQKVKTMPAAKGLEPSSLSSSPMPPLTDLLTRCQNGKGTTLLSTQESRQARAIGRSKAVLDLLCLGLVVYGVREVVSISKLVDLRDFGNDIVAIVASIFVQASRGWALFALSAALLASATNHVVFDSQIRGLSDAVGSTVRSASRYSQLYMRLVAGQPVEKQVPSRMQQAAEAQVMELIQGRRLQSFVSLVLAVMIMMTVSVIQPIILVILGSFVQFVTLPELSSWPVPWLQVASFLKEIIISSGGAIKELLVLQFSTSMHNTVGLAFQLSLCASLVSVAFLPSLVARGRVRMLEDDEKTDEDVSASAFGTVTTLSNLGVSSASRLGLLSKSGALEGTLERWRAALPPPTTVHHVHSLHSWIRQVGYTVLSTLLLMAPLFVYVSCLGGVCRPTSHPAGSTRFNSIWDVSILLLFALRSSLKSIGRTIESSNLRPHVKNFVKVLSEVVDEVSGSQERTEQQLGTPLSPSIGLNVRDLWAAHTSKRAWAVRGASFSCHHGEVVAILGDDGEGKSRLLTSIAEVLVNPAKRSLTTTKVRGVVSVGGLDSSKWDRNQLKKRLGLFLNDVRTIADNAEFMSGFTLEEILEPMDGLLNQNPTAGARAASQALRITGLDVTLLAQLPGKLSTVVTANENDLMPSELRPRCHALSPTEWSKLLFARVLAQTIFDNDNVSNAPLVGSLLLLDDVMTFLSEVEELKLLAALRKTGAATVFTSHKWASGRLADRIVVVKEGAVVESGTHTELLARGPQQSMYAAKWHAMTTGG